MLLRCLRTMPLGAAVETLVVSEDDEVEVFDQGFDVDEETGGGGDEEPVGFGHVRLIRFEIDTVLIAEKTAF